MKNKLYLLLSFVLVLWGCTDESPTLKLSNSTIVLESEAKTVTVDITASTEWSTINENDWCTLDKTSGAGDYSLQISVSKNDTGKDREASIFVKSDIDYERIKIVQYGGVDNDVFVVPVVFHVLYDNVADKSENISQSCFTELIEGVNALYASPVDVNVEFQLAKEDPDGDKMSEPGINRVKVSDCEFDIDDFMTEKNVMAENIQWNMNEYINVYVYQFKSTKDNSVVMGISHLPYTLSSNSLEGLNEGDYYLNKSKTEDYVHCVSINNKYIYDRSTAEMYTSTDAVVTLAHELGHYLGLFHAFTEGEDVTDYCDDTPDYIRADYDAWLEKLDWNLSYTLEYLSKRTSTVGESFIARNIMDYAYCYSDEFTENQRSRMRQVLNYSPLIPGPKKGRSKASTTDAVKPKFKIMR